MAKCPKCSSQLNLLKVISLSRVSNKLICKSCETVLEANKSVLSSFGITVAGLFIIIIKSGERWLGFENIFISFIIASASFITVSILFFCLVKLKISKNQDKSNFTENLNPKEKSKLRIEYLKNKFQGKSDSELRQITTDQNRTPEAREAAKQLIEERGL